MSAYVEIVLDNSDGRIPHHGQEVVIRRTIGLKKDDFSIDRKHANKTEVRDLLESAGSPEITRIILFHRAKLLI